MSERLAWHDTDKQVFVTDHEDGTQTVRTVWAEGREPVDARVAAVEAEVRALKTPEWVQPTHAGNAYANGAEVRHDGTVYRSLIPANTTTPGSDLRWWEPVTS